MLKSLINKFPLKIAAGPFAGTRCRFTQTGDGIVAKLAGTYEMELHAAWLRVLASDPEMVVDVGAAEGTYLAALGRALPEASLIGYEAKQAWHERIRQNLAMNKAGNHCELRGFCDRAELRRVLGESAGRPAFVLMDIEGGEFELLDDEMIALASNVTFIIELHEPAGREAGDSLVESFRPTHEVEVVWQNERARSWREVQSPKWRLAARLVPAIEHRFAEGRVYKMRWLCAWPKEQRA